MYDDIDNVSISVEEYEELKDKLSEYAELLEQLSSIYESLSIDLIQLGEIDLEEILEQCQKTYSEQFE